MERHTPSICCQECKLNVCYCEPEDNLDNINIKIFEFNNWKFKFIDFLKKDLTKT